MMIHKLSLNVLYGALIYINIQLKSVFKKFNILDQPIIIKAAKVGVYQNINNLSVTKHSMVTVGEERLQDIPAFQELNAWKQANNGAITLTRYAVSDRLDKLWSIQELLDFC